MSERRDRPLILLADDDPTVRLLGSETLTAAGFRVVLANDGAEALEHFRRYAPDAVILDVNMPKMSGTQACELVRSESRDDVPVLIITGQNDTAAIHSAYEAGATDFIGKPVQWAILPYRLRYVLRSSELRAQLAVSQRRTQALLEAIPDQIFLLNRDGTVVESINAPERFARTGAKTRVSLEDILPVDAVALAREHLNAAGETGTVDLFEFNNHNSNTCYEMRLLPQADDTVLAIVRDISERRRSEEQIRQLAYYDSVTGLPNRQLFLHDLRRSIRHARRTDSMVAVLYIDLDRFKRINDTFGHSIGDILLRSVAERLAKSVRPLDSVGIGNHAAANPASGTQLARLGGDEFVVLLSDIELAEQANVAAYRIRQALAAPFSYQGRQFVVTPSIGVAIYPRDGQDSETLLVRADTAMYQAKDARNTVRFYVSDMDRKALDRLRMEEELREAIDRGGLELHYQAKHSLADGTVTGAEALLRWNHAELGWVPPMSFIPLAEETGLIVPLGDWVLGEVCRQLHEWNSRGLERLRVAVNLSVEQVVRSDVTKTVMTHIWGHGIRPQNLELEITESLLMEDVDRAKDVMSALKDAGIRLAIDDFGTGYSSLSYLSQFPLDALKIDRSFIQNLHSGRDDAAICEAIIAMGKKLGMTSVAEGVELEEQRDFLARAGCDEAQGFLYTRPLPAGEFEAYLREVQAAVRAAPGASR